MIRGSATPARMLGVVFAMAGLAAASGCGTKSAGSGGPTTPFTVWIYDPRLTLDGTDKPVPNVPVALDPAGGGDRITLTTDTDGHVTFDADFSQGGASVTVFSPDHVFVTMLEATPQTAAARPNTVGKPATDLVIMPPRLDSVISAASTVGLSGNIFGKHHTAGQVALFASGLPRLGSVQTMDPAYQLRAPLGRPFFVLGHEFDTVLDPAGNVVVNALTQSFRFDLPARKDDERLDIDLATVKPLAISTLHLHAASPKGDASGASPFVAGTRAYASVQSADSGVTPGIFLSTTRSADQLSFDIVVDVAETDLAPERAITQAVLVAPDGSRSLRTELGVARDGTSWTDFPLPPTVINAGAVRGLADPIPLDGFPAGADLEAEVLAAGQRFWILYGPPGGPRAKSFTIPAQDQVTSKDVLLFAVSVSARSERVVLPTFGELYRKVGVLRDLTLRKQ